MLIYGTRKPNDMAWLLVPWAWRNMKKSSAPMSSMGSSAVSRMLSH